MSSRENPIPAYRFGVFELDNRNGDFRKGGVRIKLQEQPRRILMLLLEHPGEVVDRSEIQKNLWPDNTFVDFDNAINSAVRKLRDVLGDKAENPRFIETVARRGYRFLAPVSVIGNTQVFEAEAAPVLAIPKKRDWRFAGAAIILLTLAVALAAALIGTRGNWATPDIRVAPLTANVGVESHPSFSPDGTRVAYTWNGIDGKEFGIYVKLIGAGDPVRITKDAGRDFSPAWSPDGRWIAAIRDLGPISSIILFPSSGGQHRELARVAKASPLSAVCLSSEKPHVCGIAYFGSLLAWSPDGKYLFTSGRGKTDSGLAIIRITVDSGDLEPLVTTITSPPSGIDGDFGAAVSPDGRELAFVRLIGAKTGDLYVQPLAGAAPANSPAKRITFDGADVQSPAWTRDGRELIFSSDRLGRRGLWRIETSDSGKLLPVDGMGEGAFDIAVSPIGQRLTYNRGSYTASLWRVPIKAANDGVPVRLTATTARDKFTDISPDGKRIVFQSGRSGVEEIWICDADGTNAVQLTAFGKGMSGTPRWSPDGKTIAFDSNVAGRWDVYTIPADGGRAARVTKGARGGAVATWSRDGRWIYFASSGPDHVWKIHPDGSAETHVMAPGGFTATESVDGKYLYYKRGADDDGEIWKMPVAGGTAVKVLGSVIGRHFTVTRNGIYFASGAPRLEIRYLSFASGSIKSVAPLGNFPHADVSPDEQWALYPQLANPGTSLMVAENFR